MKSPIMREDQELTLSEPKLWFATELSFNLPISADECYDKMTSPKSGLRNKGNFLKIATRDDGAASFELKRYRSSVIATGEIVPTGTASCRVLVKVGVDRRAIILQLIIGISLGIIFLLYMSIKHHPTIGNVAGASAILYIPPLIIGYFSEKAIINKVIDKFENLRF